LGDVTLWAAREVVIYVGEEGDGEGSGEDGLWREIE
jgi:hypothetical protein